MCEGLLDSYSEPMCIGVNIESWLASSMGGSAKAHEVVKHNNNSNSNNDSRKQLFKDCFILIRLSHMSAPLDSLRT